MIDKDYFIPWLEQHFTDVKGAGDQFYVDSIFIDDTNNHLAINIDKNCYHCFKTDASGNLFDLYKKIEKCSYQDAISALTDNHLRSMEEKVNKFFTEKKNKIQPQENLIIPSETFLISILEEKDIYRVTAQEYLKSRKLDLHNLMISKNLKYRWRIFIPYYDKNGTLIYWNSRGTLKNSERYRGPVNQGVGKSDVVYVTDWKQNKIYLTEGEFDALSLTQCGINGAACGGKNLDKKQIELIKGYEICICFDTDKSGEQALHENGNKLMKNGIKKISFVRPPIDEDGGKMDWNKMLVKYGEKMIRKYIADNEESFDQWTSLKIRNK